MKRLTILFALLVAIPLASANYSKPGPNPSSTYGSVIADGTSLSTNPTFSYNSDTKVNVGGYEYVTFFVKLTWQAASKVYLQCYSYLYGDTTAYAIQALDGSNPSVSIPSYDAKLEKSVTADKAWPWTIRHRGDYVDCQVTHADANSDTIGIKVKAGAR